MVLTDKQEMFCRGYLIDLNTAQAAMWAGNCARTARTSGTENLTTPDIQNIIIELKTKRNEYFGVDADNVLRHIVAIEQMDMLDILNDDGSLKVKSQTGNSRRS
ncbi:MAG: terminase small subunit [Scandinavium sp.]|uniref:terminase small subunit n=1 Tax=Scandinavium sp. TaxID=2830653 RepID=UPI003F2D9E60